MDREACREVHGAAKSRNYRVNEHALVLISYYCPSFLPSFLSQLLLLTVVKQQQQQQQMGKEAGRTVRTKPTRMKHLSRTN